MAKENMRYNIGFNLAEFDQLIWLLGKDEDTDIDDAILDDVLARMLLVRAKLRESVGA